MKNDVLASPLIKAVNNGPDTFLVNYKFIDEQGALTGAALPDDIVEQLDTWQKQARKEHTPVETSLVFSYRVGDNRYEQSLFIRSHGSSLWSWLLDCEDIKVKMAHGTVNKGLFCQVRFSSHLLHTIGADRAIVEAEHMLYDFLGDLFDAQASEIHLCLDLQGFDFSKLQLVGDQLPFVSRVTNIRDRPVAPTEEEQEGGLTPQEIGKLEAKIREEIASEQETFPPVSLLTTHRKIATIDFGTHASDVSAQIYNKSLEVVKHRKQWFYDIWRANGWDGVSTIWRIEFRFRRAFLRKYALDGAFTVTGLFHLLWEYATTQWLRMVDVEAATGVNVSRLPTHPVWSLIQHAYEKDAIQRDYVGEQEVRLKYALQEKPLQVLKQSVSLDNQIEEDAALPGDLLAVLALRLPTTYSRALLSVAYLTNLLQKDILTRRACNDEVLERSLRDEAPSVVRELAQEEIRKLTPELLARLLDRVVPSREVVVTSLVRQERTMAKVHAAVAQALGNIRSAVALIPPGELPGSLGLSAPASRDVPDLLSSMVWFLEKARAYDKKKNRSHVDEVQKKQVRYGFVRAIEREEQRQLHGVELPKDSLYTDDLSGEDWLAVYQAFDTMRVSAPGKKLKQNNLADIA